MAMFEHAFLGEADHIEALQIGDPLDDFRGVIDGKVGVPNCSAKSANGDARD